MPVSFWLFLFVCIVGFVVVIDDHGEAWTEFKESNGLKKFWKGFKVFSIWSVAIGSLIATLILGWESWLDDKKDEAREQEFNTVTNKLAHAEIQLGSESNDLKEVKSEYNQATNDLAQAQQTAEQASNAANDANIKIQNLNRHLTPEQKEILLNAISPFPKGKLSFSAPQDVPDGLGLARDLADVFIYAGWDVNPEVNGGMILGAPMGVEVGGSNKNRLLLDTIAQTLNSFQIATKANSGLIPNAWNDITNENDIHFTIMYKPQF